MWIEAVQQGSLRSPAVRLIPASMLIYKTVIGILLHWTGQLGVSIIFSASAPYEPFSLSVSMSYLFHPGMHTVVDCLQSRLQKRVL